jgi:hypothetical protein
MAQFGSDTFTGTQFTELSAYSGVWSKHTGYTGNLILGSGGTYLIGNDAVNQGSYQHSGTPASADYEVSADVTLRAGTTTPRQAGVCARMQSGANTMYWCIYGHNTTNVRLFKNVAGTQTQLGSSYTYTLTGTAALKLICNGDQISVTLDGSTIIGPVTDTSITNAGKAGVWMFNTRETGVNDSLSLDNFSADDLGGGGGSSIAALMNHYRRRRA